MPRSDRLLRLLQAMREMHAPLTAARLAQATGVSLRSLYRDIESLRDAGAQIEGERGYGYRLVEDNLLPPQTFDRMEIEALALGLAEVQQMGDPSLAKAATAVLAKVAATLPTARERDLFHAVSKVYRPNPRFTVTPHIEPLRQACWTETALTIAYADKQGAPTERTIYPLAIVHAERVQLVLAWCCLRQAFRMFRTDGIRELEDAGISFKPQRARLLGLYLAELQGGKQPESNRPGSG